MLRFGPRILGDDGVDQDGVCAGFRGISGRRLEVALRAAPGRRAVGLRQVDEMPHDSQRGQDQRDSLNRSLIRRRPPESTGSTARKPGSKVGTTAVPAEHRRCDLESVRGVGSLPVPRSGVADRLLVSLESRR